MSSPPENSIAASASSPAPGVGDAALADSADIGNLVHGEQGAHASHYDVLEEEKDELQDHAHVHLDGVDAPDPAAIDGHPEEDQLAGLDVTNATREQLAAFAAQFSAALVGTLPDQLASSSAGFDVPADTAPVMTEGLSSAAFSMEFARASAADPAYNVLTTNGHGESASGSNGISHVGSSASVLQPPSPPPGPGVEMAGNDFMNSASAGRDVNAAEPTDGTAGEAPKKKRRTNKPRARRPKSGEQTDTPKKPRKPRREKYSNVTATIEDDTKTLEGIGRMWAENEDKKKLVPLTELFTRVWLQDRYMLVDGAEISRKKVLDSYQQDCEKYGVTGVNDSALGRAVRAEFPYVGTRRLGKRGESQYFYTGLHPRDTPLPESLAATSEQAAPEASSSRWWQATGKKVARETRSRRSSENPRSLAPPPAAYSTNPPQSIAVKPSGIPYAVSSARSAASSSRAPEQWASPSSSSANVAYSMAPTRSLRSGMAASAASSNIRTHIADDEADSDVAAMPPPPPPPLTSAPSVALESNSDLPAPDPAAEHRDASHTDREIISEDLVESTDLEGPSDVAASALFMLNQGVMPVSQSTHYTTNADTEEDAPPLLDHPRASIRRTQPGLVAKRATTSARAAPQDRPEFPVNESIFAPRKRDPNAPPRKPRKPSVRKKKGKGKGKEGTDGDGDGNGDQDAGPSAHNDDVSGSKEAQLQVDADVIQHSADVAMALSTAHGLESQAAATDGNTEDAVMMEMNAIDPALQSTTSHSPFEHAEAGQEGSASSIQ
ncbi:unnamed protein product [Tilletia controversa]|uniref:RFX-type winged-helix domain-containing protein n=1 Tax=Tilletia controversa TaxID=13291 RepID=A0A8X7N156_9BASI|nr:hypothetical protein CF328_g232 [Tilletia controversa]KAE8256015.1 hypothetical protein A4X06_0g136 [Tilletia controversa]CAD6912015.1 unnamed protein product [Tilletia controversa]CAD6928320.1 unnamed protein product [Tilletia controversa]CAD6934932.1 unnamed protein product [Tilletia controversa]